MLENLFKLKENGTNTKTEIIAGLTTFLSASYILAVIPNILSYSGMNKTSVLIATALVSALCSLAMGLFANYPMALGPGIGTAALFAFTVVPQLGSWQAGLAAVFVSGVLFFLISISGVRKMILDAIPEQLKLAIGIGIGFFITFIGLKNAKIIVANESNFVGFGNFKDPEVLLACVGILITLALLARNVPVAIFWGMLITTSLGLILHYCGVANMPQLPDHFNTQFSFQEVGGFIDGFGDLFHSLPNMILIVFSFLFIDFFDTSGTLLTVNNRMKECLSPEQGKQKDKDMNKALIVDSAANIFGSTMGVSSMATLVENTSGIALGGRTGLTAIVTGFCFALSCYLAPFINALITPAITTPALVAVGVLMCRDLMNIRWDNILYASSCLMTILSMVLGFSISNGIAMGFITYSFISLILGKAKEIHPMIWILDVVFLFNFYLMS